MKLKFKIEGLNCPNCAKSLEKSISRLESIESVSINFITQKMIIKTNNENSNELITEINKLIKSEKPEVSITLK